MKVELPGRDAQEVPRRAGLDHRRVEEAAQLGDLPLHLRHRRDGSGAMVEIVGEPLDRDDPVRPEQQDCEGGALLGPAERNGAVAATTSSGPRRRNSSTLGP